jgi:hypothetical protein
VGVDQEGGDVKESINFKKKKSEIDSVFKKKKRNKRGVKDEREIRE